MLPKILYEVPLEDGLLERCEKLCTKLNFYLSSLPVESLKAADSHQDKRRV